MALCIFELNGLEYSFAGQERSHGTSYCVCIPDGANCPHLLRYSQK